MWIHSFIHFPTITHQEWHSQLLHKACWTSMNTCWMLRIVPPLTFFFFYLPLFTHSARNPCTATVLPPYYSTSFFFFPFLVFPFMVNDAQPSIFLSSFQDSYPSFLSITIFPFSSFCFTYIVFCYIVSDSWCIISFSSSIFCDDLFSFHFLILVLLELL